MNRFVFFDTETTAAVDGRLVQIALKGPEPDEFLVDTFKPPVPITFEAMAIHHITEKAVAGRPPFEGTFRERVAEQFLHPDVIAVAHNAPFDIAVLKREGVEVPRWIDTLKIARRLRPEFAQHTLQYLRYAMGIEIDAGNAHDARADVLVLEQVFGVLTAEARLHLGLAPDPTGEQLERDDQAIDEWMQKISREPSLLHVVAFGKHKGKTWADVARDDLSYLFWLQKQDTDEDVRHTVDHWLHHYQQRIGKSV
jgi:exodeoxyribonuclease X